jgi:ABC-type transport system involved in multi-copper enzyme maturation permease subunit
VRVFWRLVRKQLHELRWAVLLCWLMLAVFFVFATYLYRTFGDTSAAAMARLSPELVVGMFGGLLGGLDQLEMWLLTLYLHPLVLTLYSAITIAIASRGLAGEIERGTLDLLLACPVPRGALVASAATATLAVQALLTATALLAMRLGLRLADIEPPDSLARFGLVAINLWALFVAVGGISLLFSAAAAEQGKAIGRSIGFLVASFFVNLLASFWSKVRWADFLSVFHYHQPQPLFTGRESLWEDLAVLLAVGVVAHAAAFAVFVRRDIAAT